MPAVFFVINRKPEGKRMTDPTTIFQRNLAKIDRRIQKPNLPKHLKDDLWRLRNELFDSKTTAEAAAELDHSLRYFDRMAKKSR
jgi:hypothetical protein